MNRRDALKTGGLAALLAPLLGREQREAEPTEEPLAVAEPAPSIADEEIDWNSFKGIRILLEDASGRHDLVADGVIVDIQYHHIDVTSLGSLEEQRSTSQDVTLHLNNLRMRE